MYELDYGQPVTILRVDGNRKYLIDEEAFSSIVDQVGDLPIVIYSQNGKRRRGKSLALNYMKLFLASNGSRDWMSLNVYEDESPIESNCNLSNSEDYEILSQISDTEEQRRISMDRNNSFHWQSGDSDTTEGIVMWSKPFPLKLSNGQTYAVLLMDCQGNASDDSDNVDNGVIFSLSMLLSSIFIYNISGDLDNLTLQFFHQYADYAIQVFENTSTDMTSSTSTSSDMNCPRYNKQFQDLLIWVRDWQGHAQYPFGFYEKDTKPIEAESNFILDKVQPKAGQSEENQAVRVAIKSVFQRVISFLTPFPGREIVDKDFNGIIDPKSEFGLLMKLFVETVFSEESINPKAIGKRIMFRNDLKEYFHKLTLFYRDSEKLPKFKSVTETSNELICRNAIKVSWDHYMERMNKAVISPVPLEPHEFKECHSMIVKECMAIYKSSANVGLQLKLKFMKELVTQIEKSYLTFVSSNNERWERIHNDL